MNLMKRTSFLGGVTMAVLLLGFSLLCHSAKGAELLRNPSFSDGFYRWKTIETADNWSPYVYDETTGGHINLHPASSLTGALVRQSLNVSGVANQQVLLSFKLRKNSAASGNTISVRLQYVTTGDQVRETEVLSPANDSIADWTLVSGSITFPADARKLTSLVVYKQDYGDFDADDFSLTGASLTPDPVPEIYSGTPVAAPYGSVVTIGGLNLGSTQGTVSLHGSASGLSIQSWATDQVSVLVQEPARSGRWVLLADFVEADGDPNFDLTSPNFTVDALGSPYRAIKGAPVYVPLQVHLLNGFTTANGIGFFLPDAPEAASFAPSLTKVSGGVLMKIDTTGISPGVHKFNIQTLEDNSYARFVPFELELVNVADIKFTQFGSELPAGPLAVSAQGEVSGLGFTLLDVDGKALDLGSAVVTSSNPAVLFAKKDNFGFWRFFVLDNGSASLTVTAPDGYNESLTVNVSVPASPKVMGVGFTHPILSNKGDVLNTFNATGTDPLGVGWENISLVEQDTQWSAGNTQLATTFKVKEGEMPGTYLFRAYTFSGTFETGITETSVRYDLLTVVNDPTRGMVSGRIADLSSASGFAGHMLNGTLELYDASSQALVTERFVYLMGDPAYTLPYIAPGDYKLRFVPGDTRKAIQWYPNATSFAAAGAINVTAGNTASGINLFLNTISLREAIDFDTPDIFTSGFQILGGDSGWYGQRGITHDGSDAVQSPMLMDEGAAFVEGTIEGPGTLTFWWKVSSEANADKLTFTLNWDMENQLLISGEVDWAQVTVELPAGANTVSWQYAKNASGSGGMDAAWLDQVTFTPSGSTSAPVIQTHPQSQAVNSGANVQFVVTATGTPPLTYQWKKNNVDIPGAVSDTLSLNNVQSGDAATYTVVVGNSAGTDTSDPATLTVNVPPSISLHPQSQTVNPGANVQFTVTATGTAPLAYQWKKNGENIPGANSSTLTLNNVQAADAASYTVLVSNNVGSVPSNAAVLTLNQAPVIVAHPQSQTVNIGATVQFSVNATGTLPLSYQWQKNEVDIPGATAASLTLNNIQPGDAATYTVIVSNVAGSAPSNPATLGINTPPSVSVAPVSQTVSPGSEVIFAVTAAGTGPLSYQWLFDGEPIPGAVTASYSIASAADVQAGAYSVMITGPGGSVESVAAQLTVVELHMYAGILVQGAIGNQYRIDYTTSLNEPVNWTLLKTVTLTSREQVFVDENSYGQARRFYRTVLIVP